MTNRIRKTLDVKLVDLTAKAVDGWLMRMSDNNRPATIQSSFVVLKDMEMNVTRSVDELFAAVPRAEN